MRDLILQWWRRWRYEPVRLLLCEQNYLVLKPDTRYVFTVDPGCVECARLASVRVWDEPGHAIQ